MSEYERKIERGLILWLREIHNIVAEEASIDAEGETESYGYCDTCCYGESAVAKIYVNYKVKGESHWNRDDIEVGSNSLDFLPVLLPYIDRAN